MAVREDSHSTPPARLTHGTRFNSSTGDYIINPIKN
nr:MAG TPA: hypothetical protein [Caudoviricetes sp.]